MRFTLKGRWKGDNIPYDNTANGKITKVLIKGLKCFYRATNEYSKNDCKKRVFKLPIFFISMFINFTRPSVEKNKCSVLSPHNIILSHIVFTIRLSRKLGRQTNTILVFWPFSVNLGKQFSIRSRQTNGDGWRRLGEQPYN